MGVVKTWNGIARSSLKTWDGIAAASVKTINGFDATTGVSYDFEENFETATTGYENTGWTTAGSSNPAYSTSPAPLQGTQSLYAATGGVRGAYRSNSLTGEIWYYWLMYCVGGVVSDWHFYGDAAETGILFGFNGGKAGIRIVGQSTAYAATDFPLDQTVHVWLRYKPGTGDASSDLYYSTDGIRGTAKASLSGLTKTVETTRPYWLSRSTYAVIWDRIIINSSAIGDNP